MAWFENQARHSGIPSTRLKSERAVAVGAAPLSQWERGGG
ncbi:hypothetical protein CYA_0792 [Synechococcus sp. JA-3-3Ab]|nr:hypothetical protein CYA_0792 [Synechococcus sp. JA-3-3Ab]